MFARKLVGAAVLSFMILVAMIVAVQPALADPILSQSACLRGAEDLPLSDPAGSSATGVPVLNSNPGAAYTVYLDFAGFNFNVNVTTVDPAVVAGQADTDAHRQAYYETQARMMHTVVTTSYSWYSPAGGVSYVGVTPNSYDPSGYNGGAGAGWKTNWIFTNGSGVGHTGASAAIHENGHGLDLYHQSDYNSSHANEYSYGDDNGSSTPGGYAPIMGAAYYTQRGAWRQGNVGSSASIQNDPVIMANLSGMGGYRDGGVGHSLAAATVLPHNGLNITPAIAAGIINPASSSSPNPIGIDSYTKDYWKFTSDGVHTTSLTVWDGHDLLVTGAQDGDPILRSDLNILDSNGSLIGSAIEAGNTLSESYSALLPAGTYYAQVTSFGGHTQTLADGSGGYFQTTYYYDMGAYFVTGTVPEPATLSLLAFSGLILIRRRRNRP